MIINNVQLVKFFTTFRRKENFKSSYYNRRCSNLKKCCAFSIFVEHTLVRRLTTCVLFWHKITSKSSCIIIVIVHIKSFKHPCYVRVCAKTLPLSPFNWLFKTFLLQQSFADILFRLFPYTLTIVNLEIYKIPFISLRNLATEDCPWSGGFCVRFDILIKILLTYRSVTGADQPVGTVSVREG